MTTTHPTPLDMPAISPSRAAELLRWKKKSSKYNQNEIDRLKKISTGESETVMALLEVIKDHPGETALALARMVKRPLDDVQVDLAITLTRDTVEIKTRGKSKTAALRYYLK